jgi:hypothetical protein
VISGETAAEWRDGDEGALNAWASTFAAVLTEAMCAAASGAAGLPDEVDLHVPGAGLAMMFFMARREGLTAQEVSEIVEEGLSAELPPGGRAYKAWGTWRQVHGDPAEALLAQLAEARARGEEGEALALVAAEAIVLNELNDGYGAVLDLLRTTPNQNLRDYLEATIRRSPAYPLLKSR